MYQFIDEITFQGIVTKNEDGALEVLPVTISGPVNIAGEIPPIVGDAPNGCILDELQIIDLDDNADAAELAQEQVPSNDVVYADTLEDLIRNPYLKDGVVKGTIERYIINERGDMLLLLTKLASEVCKICPVADICRYQNGRMVKRMFIVQ